MIENNIEGINPTAEFIAQQQTGKFVKILPDTYLIKGAKNEKGFDQGFALSNSFRKEFVLIDVVEEATREAIQDIIRNGYNIRAILITGKSVLNDAYAELRVLSEEAGGADIYLHPELSPDTGFSTKDITTGDSLISSFKLEISEIPGVKDGSVMIYSNKNEGMLFVGDSVKGSDFDSDEFLFTRQKSEKKGNEFEQEDFWQNLGKEFYYLFPRIGKPAIEVDPRTRTTILSSISRGR